MGLCRGPAFPLVLLLLQGLPSLGNTPFGDGWGHHSFLVWSGAAVLCGAHDWSFRKEESVGGPLGRSLDPTASAALRGTRAIGAACLASCLLVLSLRSPKASLSHGLQAGVFGSLSGGQIISTTAHSGAHWSGGQDFSQIL